MEELSEAPGSAPRSRYCRSLQILRFADIGCFFSDRMLSTITRIVPGGRACERFLIY